MILYEILKSKIQNAIVTKTQLNYQGSIGIDKALLKKSGIFAGEKVHVLNLNNGSRLETYVLEEKENSGAIVLYGPAARAAQVGDKIVIISYVLVTADELKNIKQKNICLNEKNQPL